MKLSNYSQTPKQDTYPRSRRTALFTVATAASILTAACGTVHKDVATLPSLSGNTMSGVGNENLKLVDINTGEPLRVELYCGIGKSMCSVTVEEPNTALEFTLDVPSDSSQSFSLKGIRDTTSAVSVIAGAKQPFELATNAAIQPVK
jgi:hypothetical protein